MSEFVTSPDNHVKGVFLEAIGKVKNNELLSLSDLYVGVSFDDLALTVYDDEEALLAQANIDEWADFKEDPDTFQERVTEVLKKTLHEKDLKDAIEALDVIRPFSVVLVDEDFEQKEELFRLDDNLVVIEDDFLKNIDQELDDFLKNLLADV
ncbi:MAG: hypothetical protein RR202_07535 [Bacteroidales bacterium]